MPVVAGAVIALLRFYPDSQRRDNADLEYTALKRSRFPVEVVAQISLANFEKSIMDVERKYPGAEILLHLSGHGAEGGVLQFVRDSTFFKGSTEEQAVDPKRFIAIIGQHQAIRGVMLSACNTSRLATELEGRGSVDFAIGFEGTISTDDANRLFEAFYLHLETLSVEDAWSKAIAASALHDGEKTPAKALLVRTGNPLLSDIMVPDETRVGPPKLAFVDKDKKAIGEWFWASRGLVLKSSGRLTSNHKIEVHVGSTSLGTDEANEYREGKTSPIPPGLGSIDIRATLIGDGATEQSVVAVSFPGIVVGAVLVALAGLGAWLQYRLTAGYPFRGIVSFVTGSGAVGAIGLLAGKYREGAATDVAASLAKRPVRVSYLLALAVALLLLPPAVLRVTGRVLTNHTKLDLKIGDDTIEAEETRIVPTSFENKLETTCENPVTSPDAGPCVPDGENASGDSKLVLIAGGVQRTTHCNRHWAIEPYSVDDGGAAWLTPRTNCTPKPQEATLDYFKVTDGRPKGDPSVITLLLDRPDETEPGFINIAKIRKEVTPLTIAPFVYSTQKTNSALLATIRPFGGSFVRSVETSLDVATKSIVVSKGVGELELSENGALTGTLRLFSQPSSVDLVKIPNWLLGATVPRTCAWQTSGQRNLALLCASANSLELSVAQGNDKLTLPARSVPESILIDEGKQTVSCTHKGATLIHIGRAKDLPKSCQTGKRIITNTAAGFASITTATDSQWFCWPDGIECDAPTAGAPKASQCCFDPTNGPFKRWECIAPSGCHVPTASETLYTSHKCDLVCPQ